MTTEDPNPETVDRAGKRPKLYPSGRFNAEGAWKITLTAPVEERTIEISYDVDSIRVEMYEHRRPRQRSPEKVLGEFEIRVSESVSEGKFTNVEAWYEDDEA